MSAVRHHPKNGPKYEGSLNEAVVVNNRKFDEKTFSLPALDKEGKPVLDKAEKPTSLNWTLGSSLDEKLPDSCNARILIAKSDWERAKEQPAVKHWIREGEIDAHSAS